MGTGQSASRAGERWFFASGALLLTFLVIAAFTPSFFLRGPFHRPAPTPFIALHGILMTGWMLLFAVQALLVAMGRTGWHHRLGYAGVGFAALLVPIGCMATLASAAREVHAHSRFVGFQLNILGLELAQMLLFGGFVAAGTALRARLDWHKRLMLLATLCLLPNAIVRLSLTPVLDFLDSNQKILPVWAGLLVLVAGIDALRTRRIHPAFAIGVPLAVAILCAAMAISLGGGWRDFWLNSLT